jgi:ferredoxin
VLRTRWERGGIEVEGGCLFVVFVSGGKLLCEKMMRELFRPDGAGRIRNDSDNLIRSDDLQGISAVKLCPEYMILVTEC